jgi:exodeoxyribonuclease-3
MRIISINVNGIRAAERKGFFDWLKRQRADIVCIQELKAQVHQLGDPVFWPGMFHCHYVQAEKKGYSGVGLYARKEPDTIINGFGVEEFDLEGRYIEARFGDLSIISLYAPSGSAGDHRQESKDRFLEVFPYHLAHEREWMDHLFKEDGFYDAYRVIEPETEQYTWWSNRGSARENNVGWRIDYQVITPQLADKVIKARVYTDKWFSDHAPLIMDYEHEL